MDMIDVVDAASPGVEVAVDSSSRFLSPFYYFDEESKNKRKEMRRKKKERLRERGRRETWK